MDPLIVVISCIPPMAIIAEKNRRDDRAAGKYLLVRPSVVGLTGIGVSLVPRVMSSGPASFRAGIAGLTL
jgi:hypothetical protein